MFGVAVLCLLLACVVYFRMAPSDPVRWHKGSKIEAMGEKEFAGGYIWRETVSKADGLAKMKALDARAQATAATSVLTGSVDAGQVTYVTRSRIFGFPDYTTVGLYDAEGGQTVFEVYSRLRFGKSDLGVNAKRVKGWLAAVE